MPPNNPDRRSPGRCRYAIAALGVALWVVQTAQGHVISIVRGAATVHRDRIEVELTINAEDFVHYCGMVAVPGRPLSVDAVERAAARHADHLLEHFIIRNADGERLSGKLISLRTHESAVEVSRESRPHSSHIVYSLEYALIRPPPFLSFQQTIGAGDAGLPSQLYLDVRAAADERGTTLRLTSGGNLETLRLQWPDADSGSRPMIVGPLEELKFIGARMEIGDTSTRIEVDVPMPLLDMFLAIPRAERDFLDPEEQSAGRRAIEQFFRSRLALRIDGQTAEPRDAAISFFGLNAGESTDRSLRLSAWTTRVRATLSYSSSAPPRDAELRWTLFNAAVLEARAVVACENRESVHRLSTYEPILHWRRESMNGNAGVSP